MSPPRPSTTVAVLAGWRPPANTQAPSCWTSSLNRPTAANICSISASDGVGSSSRLQTDNRYFGMVCSFDGGESAPGRSSLHQHHERANPGRTARGRLSCQDVAMRPMLAMSAARVPAGADWVHEVKWDGMRVLADVAGGRVTLTSRTERDVTVAFPELSALADQFEDMLLDGEIVAMRAGIP